VSAVLPGPFRRLAAALRENRSALLEQWVKDVFADTDIPRADELTHAQLVDHLPRIFEELCAAIELQDLDALQPAIQHDAKGHGQWRWQQGYKLDELVRELELFRQAMIHAIAAFATANPDLGRLSEAKARHLVDEALSQVTLTSIREVVHERDSRIDQYTGMIERSNQQLLLKQQLLDTLYESRLQVARRVAHDLRNFLHGFTTHLELIERAPARLAIALKLARRQVGDMKTLVDEMVDYAIVLSDGVPVNPEVFEIRELFDELVAAFDSPIKEKGLGFSTRFEAGLGTACTDRLKIKQIALNLLSNATKYTREGSIDFAVFALSPRVLAISVSDTGIGIPPGDRERVFAEFERAADDDIPGSGIGLAIVKELVKALGGTLHYGANPGRGSRFEVRLPRELPPTADAP
jgi:signal transduction histidine kinase